MSVAWEPRGASVDASAKLIAAVEREPPQERL
jgi:hypothetical protein